MTTKEARNQQILLERTLKGQRKKLQKFLLNIGETIIANSLCKYTDNSDFLKDLVLRYDSNNQGWITAEWNVKLPAVTLDSFLLMCDADNTAISNKPIDSDLIKLRDKIAVMEHFSKGGEIEFKDRDAKDWNVTTMPVWNWRDFTYRIKKPISKITLEKWLLKIKDKNFYFTHTTNNINVFIATHLGVEKVKLLKSYEEEI